jgi:hypothetical protein
MCNGILGELTKKTWFIGIHILPLNLSRMIMRPTKNGLVAQRRHTLCQGTAKKRSIFEDAMIDPPVLLLYLTFFGDPHDNR